MQENDIKAGGRYTDGVGPVRSVLVIRTDVAVCEPVIRFWGYFAAFIKPVNVMRLLTGKPTVEYRIQKRIFGKAWVTDWECSLQEFAAWATEEMK